MPAKLGFSYGSVIQYRCSFFGSWMLMNYELSILCVYSLQIISNCLYNQLFLNFISTSPCMLLFLPEAEALSIRR